MVRPLPAPLAVTFGRAVRRLRDRRGISQTDLARAAKMDAGDLSRLERGLVGERGPGLGLVERLAKALDVPASRLLSSSRP
jgi:transcriptional regulator with XRE-family HTH domain